MSRYGIAALSLPVIVLLLVAAELPPASAGRITAGADMSVARADHTATLLPDGRVLIAGGMVENGVFLNSMEIFDPSARRFTSAANMAAARVGHSATLLSNGKVLLAGGLSQRPGIMAARAELYEPKTGRLFPAGTLVTPRNGHEAVLLGDGTVIIVGGYDGHRFLDTVERYDPATNTFSAAGKLTIGRAAFAAALLHDGRILIAGGATGSETEHRVLRSAEIYDPQTGRSTLVADMSAPRYKHAATLLQDGRVLITGGSDERDWHGVWDTAEIYDPARRTFTAVAKMNSKRFKLPHATVLLKNGDALIAGGNRIPEIYESSTGSFKPVSGNMGEPKLFASATLLRDGRVLIAGGYGNGTPDRGPLSTKESWIYEP